MAPILEVRSAHRLYALAARIVTQSKISIVRITEEGEGIRVIGRHPTHPHRIHWVFGG